MNSEFSFSLTSCLSKAEEPILPYYLSIAGGRIIGFIPFPRILVLCEMQSVSSRIWTRVTVSISDDNNHYTTGTFSSQLWVNSKMGLIVQLIKKKPCVESCFCRKFRVKHIDWVVLLIFFVVLIFTKSF